jgi:hypothetical protein
MGDFLATPACAADLAGNTDYEIGPAVPLEFDGAGDLPPVTYLPPATCNL